MNGVEMRDRAVTAVWVVGLALAALVYLVGPDRFLETVFVEADHLAEAAQQALLLAGARAYDVVRALAIACFAIFFALSVIATGRGQPARGLLLIVSLLFLVLVWHEGPEATGHWLLAFLLAAAGAASMTRRLSSAPRMLAPRDKERF
jgi:hypothetical protein